MLANTQDCVDKLNEIKATVSVLNSSLKEKEAQVEIEKKAVESLIKARFVLTEVAELTQRRFKDRVESLVTMALRSVYDRPYRFELRFERKRNQFECKPIIWEGDVECEDLEFDLGGGVVDIVSFAFRVVLWNLERPRSRNVFILDEPVKFVGKGETQHRAGKMIREISHKLKVQILLITHEPDLAEIGDRTFVVTHDRIKSSVRVLEKLSELEKISIEGKAVDVVEGVLRRREKK
jgi:hypothetical protein